MANLMVLQMTSCPDVESNLAFVESQLAGLTVTEPTMVVLPECFACFGGGDNAQANIAETIGNGPVQQRLAQLAKTFGVWIVAGSFPTRNSFDHRFSASCLVFNDQGELIADYQKIHLFDVQVADNTGRYAESASTQPGNKIVCFDSPFGRVGVAICYDLRFAGLFQAMGEIDVLVLPAAFTAVTGQAHWLPLLRARAIELQCYVAAANQTGIHANGRQTYGHSSVISPWGEVLVELPAATGLVGTKIDYALLADIRQRMPVGQHNCFRSTFVEPR
ncbi:carbon-nitrogen hydrolase family protein [Bowmanella sp. JS7-9]|uniref:Carbon-nitrogen hydrolase family protein n=1 Tax=Pseudobowmanella zhangzhouensis TaxID=1537679 RepID=A0ABW1XPG0_9ALTE|nr:carbon-nitrogen hydrolase family protein [Bowmanella sp. JS7-9]TBX21805.1 amidohydrolase [Bowmanella sp. JS7-9]